MDALPAAFTTIYDRFEDMLWPSNLQQQLGAAAASGATGQRPAPGDCGDDGRNAVLGHSALGKTSETGGGVSVVLLSGADRRLEPQQQEQRLHASCEAVEPDFTECCGMLAATECTFGVMSVALQRC